MFQRRYNVVRRRIIFETTSCVYGGLLSQKSHFFTTQFFRNGTFSQLHFHSTATLPIYQLVVEGVRHQFIYLYFFIYINLIQVKIRFNKCTISNTVTNTAINAFPVVKYEVDLVKRKRGISRPPKQKKSFLYMVELEAHF